MKKYLFFTLSITICLFSFSQKNITVDFSNDVGEIKPHANVNRGPYDMTEGYKDVGVLQIRPHDDRETDYYNYSDFWIYNTELDTFTDINTAFNPAVSESYNWTDLDQQISTIVDNGFEVYFRLGVSWPENDAVTRPPTTPPYDPDLHGFTNFTELCRRTIMHLNEGWDNGFYHNIEYWEIWNEPDYVFWDTIPEEFYRMYFEVAVALKMHDPNLKIGGSAIAPLTMIPEEYPYFIEFIDTVVSENIPMDFFSWHLYGAVNPYGIKYHANRVRHIMDSLGLVNAESHINEINWDLETAQDELQDKAKGAAYLLSTLITVQEADVDKIFWYPGPAFFNDDVMGQASVKMNGYGMKAYSLIYENTPNQIETTGDEVVEEYLQTDTTNLMSIAGKSNNGEMVYVAISNFNSLRTNFLINLQNLPWTSEDQIRITINKIQDPDVIWEETISIIQGNSELEIPVTDMGSPSIFLLRFEKISSGNNDILNLESEKIFIYPNPATQNVNFDFYLNSKEKVSLKIFDSNGRLVKTLIDNNLTSGTYSIPWDLRNAQGVKVMPGQYYCTYYQAGRKLSSEKIIVE